MKIPILLIMIVSFSLSFVACKKDNPVEKYCNEGPLFYKSGSKYLSLSSAVTPDGDGVNDIFVINTNMNSDSFGVRIYQPDGKLVFENDASKLYWDMADIGSKEIYQFYVETTIKSATSTDILKCAPLFLLKTEHGCTVNARKEDTAKYVFADQLLPDGGKWPATNQCLKF